MKFSLRRSLAVVGLVPAVIAACSLEACSSKDEESKGPQTPAERLEAETHTRWIVDEDKSSGTPDMIVALDPIPPTAINGVSHEQAARQFIEQHKDMFKLRDPAKQLALEEVLASRDGTAHVRFVQREGGLRVEGSVLGVHFRADGSVAMLNVVIAPDAVQAVGTPTVTPAAAIAAAEAALRADYPGYAPTWLSATPQPKLVLAPRGAGAVLGWRLTLDGSAPGEPFGRTYLVDAKTSAIVETSATLADQTGKGIGVKGDEKSFAVRRQLFFAGSYIMQQFQFFGGTLITTYDANQKKAVVSSDKLDEWDRVAIGPGAAVDAHTYVTAADSYFRRFHGWASADGRGSPLAVYAHDNELANNAWWDGKALHFSDGNVHTGGQSLPRSAGPDTVGHEFMHGVTQNTSGLKYEGQSGAMNEALSDIFGQYVEAEIHPGSRFEHGDQSGPVLRDLARPLNKGQPDNMSVLKFPGEKPTKDNDWAGVHYNSGVVNNAWYLMTIGGINETSTIPVFITLGLDDSRKLWWATARYFLNSTSQFDRAARWQAGWSWITGRPIEAVGCAWVATGVLTNKYVKDNYKVQCYCELPDGGVQQPDQMQCCAPGKQDECCKPCEEAGPPPSDGGAPSDPTGEPTDPDLFDSCKGRADGIYCSQLSTYSGIQCEGETIALGVHCPNLSKCLGPNGPGAQIQCEGQAPSNPGGGDGGTDPPLPDSCAGRADGIYCSTLAPYSAYECQGGAILSGHLCPEGKTCKGPNGPGALVCQ